ncbi:MAG TPA: hypothetical protein VFE07_03635 [Marmoricola sp.]|nr:hypothetical protein [Marmoricola sp.]
MRAFAGAAVTAVLVLGLCGPSTAIAPTDSLPRGADTVVPYVVTSDAPAIRAPGVDIPLPPEVTGSDDVFLLVGRTELGWLVDGVRGDGEGGTDHEVLNLVTATGSTRLLDFGHYDGSPSYRLATSGKRILRYPIGDMSEYLTVYDLSGRVVANRRVARTLHDSAQVWDFSGSRVLYANRSWRIGHRPRVLTKRTVAFADIGHNALAVRVSHKRRAFATLSHPNRLRWRARFQPDVISPNGNRVAGWAVGRRGGLRGVIQVRRVKNGKILASIDVSNVIGSDAYIQGADSLVRWESNRAFVFNGRNSSGSDVIIRCTITKVCARASDPAPYLSFAPTSGR